MWSSTGKGRVNTVSLGFLINHFSLSTFGLFAVPALVKILVYVWRSTRHWTANISTPRGGVGVLFVVLQGRDLFLTLIEEFNGHLVLSIFMPTRWQVLSFGAWRGKEVSGSRAHLLTLILPFLSFLSRRWGWDSDCSRGCWRRRGFSKTSAEDRHKVKGSWR